MLAIIGDISIHVALLLNLLLLTNVYFILNNKTLPNILSVKHCVRLSFLSALIAFVALTMAFVQSDFALEIVFKNSHTDKPLLYKITGVWGNHEGSMLLFALLLHLYNIFYLWRSSSKNTPLILSIQGLVGACIMSYICFTSNPFITTSITPSNGLGLNPLLQDIGLAIHPPMLYLGYTGFAFAISTAIACLLLKSFTQEEAGNLRRWTLLPWSFLTLGIGLGSWWAYRELGWGGYWFWDPVENASLLPWLTATSLFHCLLVVEKRDQMKGWALFLGILTFLLAILGFFLVRSGILTSVHSFASDPSRGVFLLAILAIIGTISIGLFSARIHHISTAKGFKLLSRESSIALNNLLLMTLCFTIFLGTLYPLILNAVGESSVSVGAPFYNAVFNPIALALVAAASLAPFINWQQSSLIQLRKKYLLSLMLGGIAALGFFTIGTGILSTAGMCIGTLVVISLVNYLRQKGWSGLPYSSKAMVVSHLGLGILTLAISLNAAFKTEDEAFFAPSDKRTVDGITLQITKTEYGRGPNYLVHKGHVKLSEGGKTITTLHPENRVFLGQKQQTIEAAIHSTPTRDLYIAMGEGNPEQGVGLRFYNQPAMNWIWIGCTLIALGGLVGLKRKKKF